MKIFDRLMVLRTASPTKRGAAKSAAAWSAAKSSQTVDDLVRLGGLLAMQPANYAEGIAQPDPIDPQRLAYEAGRRDLAIQLLTLMGVGPYELMQLMDDEHAHVR